ncbi:hypothetical protein QF027_000117 [Streptomyces canus]|nr:hypothetical protein [Streptomyces canus]
MMTTVSEVVHLNDDVVPYLTVAQGGRGCGNEGLVRGPGETCAPVAFGPVRGSCRDPVAWRVTTQEGGCSPYARRIR